MSGLEIVSFGFGIGGGNKMKHFNAKPALFQRETQGKDVLREPNIHMVLLLGDLLINGRTARE